MFQNKGRSLMIGFFVMFATILYIVFSSFVSTMRSGMEDKIIQAVTGNLQIRPASATDVDMVTLKHQADSKSFMEDAQSKQIVSEIGSEDELAVRRVRFSTILTANGVKYPVTLVGLDQDFPEYKQAFKLTDGRYLDGSAEGETLLTTTQATKLGVKVGDSIEVYSMKLDPPAPDGKLKVVGIGDFEMLSMFGYSAAYTQLSSAQHFIGFEHGEVSEIIVYDRANPKAGDTSQLQNKLHGLGITASDVKVSAWKDMGGFIMGGVTLYKALFFAFIFILLFITCILLMNLILMIAMERRQEIGTLRAIGFSRNNIILIFIAEILLICLFSNLAGFVVGSGIVVAISHIAIHTMPPLAYIMGTEFFIQYHAIQVLPIIGIMLGIGLLSSLIPSFRISSLKPVEALKEE
ncbi:ABC transporter permease [Paenibacillus monticola]|nr:FtsX-like permease family protein [Paenibacillus monticola]